MYSYINNTIHLYATQYTVELQMTQHLNVSLSDEFKEVIDKKRGMLPISIFVRMMLAKGLGLKEDIALSERDKMVQQASAQGRAGK